ncbi:hypothetical protein Cgig2_027363 [Carnegiea gigantea]|uniref:Uncharacterized protein n=1 Tax=Carnegiea gigantea TaxID=171969 RepID=A0A9Q1GPP7_9CARY|nr:hypothetical protein Cgig2_027363 [Carnegiea gigantea]
MGCMSLLEVGDKTLKKSSLKGGENPIAPPKSKTAAHYELPELPQAIFYAIILNEAEKFGVLHGPRLQPLKVALTELRWGAFESWMDMCLRWVSHWVLGNFPGLLFPPRWRSTSRPPRPLPEDFNLLCPCFSLAEAEATAVESELPEIIQATFYAVLLNEMVELSVVHEYTAERMRSLLVGLRWSILEVWMRIIDKVIRGAQLHRHPDEVEAKGARDGQGEGSRLADPPIL